MSLPQITPYSQVHTYSFYKDLHDYKISNSFMCIIIFFNFILSYVEG